MSNTPIESRAMWSLHHFAAEKAKAEGSCADCQQRAGFRATDAIEGKPTPPVLCHRRHRPDHPWANATRAMHEGWAAARKKR
jgi:hypothetical protein